MTRGDSAMYSFSNRLVTTAIVFTVRRKMEEISRHNE